MMGFIYKTEKHDYRLGNGNLSAHHHCPYPETQYWGNYGRFRIRISVLSLSPSHHLDIV